MKRLLLATLAASLAFSASARDLGQWTDVDAGIRNWFQSLRQPDNPTWSCCGEADAYWADSFEVDGDQYVAIITDERTLEYRTPIPVGTRVKIPKNKVKFDQGNPTGHGIIFISTTGLVYCYLPPGGT